MSDLDKEHDRRAALLNPRDDNALDRLDSWHASMTDMIDAQYCAPGGNADDDISGSNDEAAEVATALGGFPDA